MFFVKLIFSTFFIFLSSYSFSQNHNKIEVDLERVKKDIIDLQKFVYQNKPRGTGDAVLKAKKYIKSNFFLMLLPDDLIVKNNCSKSMIDIHNRYKSSVMASMNVNKKNVSRGGCSSCR